MTVHPAIDLCIVWGVFFIFTDRVSPIYPVIYAVANPVRGMLDRKISEEHLQSSNESIKQNKTKNDKKKGKKSKRKRKYQKG